MDMFAKNLWRKPISRLHVFKLIWNWETPIPLVTYYPRREGMEEDRSETMQFIEFMRRILLAYRELHRMHHLIKAILYYPLLMR